MHVTLGQHFFYKNMTFNFPSHLPQNHGRRTYNCMHNNTPRTHHLDPPFPTNIPQGAALERSNESIPQIKDDPDNGTSLAVSTSESQASSPDFVSSDAQRLVPANEAMIPLYPVGNHYPHVMHMHDMRYVLEGPPSAAIEEHLSTGSDTYLRWDGQDGIFPSPEAALPPAHIDQLPSHDVTESYLRQTLNILPPRPVDLTSLPDQPWRRQPRITDMIKLAIWGSGTKKLTLRQIYHAIEERYPLWRDQADKPWQRSIRHNLSLKAIFVQVERPIGHPGKGFYWTIDVREGEGNKRRRRRRDGAAGSSTSNASEDSESDRRTRHGFTSGRQESPYRPPQNTFQPSDRTDLLVDAYTMRTSSSHRQAVYSEPSQTMGLNMRWNSSSSSPHLQNYHGVPMDSSGMHLLRNNTYPPIALPDVDHRLMQGSGPMAGHGYFFPELPASQGNPPPHSARPSRSRHPLQHGDVSTEENKEEIVRSSRTHRGH